MTNLKILREMNNYEKTLILQGLQLQVDKALCTIAEYRERFLREDITFGALVDEGKILDANTQLVKDLNSLMGKIRNGQKKAGDDQGNKKYSGYIEAKRKWMEDKVTYYEMKAAWENLGEDAWDAACEFLGVPPKRMDMDCAPGAAWESMDGNPPNSLPGDESSSRRCWRFGQTNIPITPGVSEDVVKASLERKEKDEALFDAAWETACKSFEEAKWMDMDCDPEAN